jgi:hypothetical protein
MEHHLDQALESLRPHTSPELVASLALLVDDASRPAPKRWPRATAAVGVSSGMLAALGSVGGISYGATAVTHAVAAATKASAPAASAHAIAIRGLSAGGDQYTPGYGFGDPNHNHDGPPGMTRTGGEDAPPLATRPADALARVAGTTVTIDEQAHLYISVIDRTGTPLLLTQESKRGGSSIGGNAATGPQTKFIQYVVRVPRPIELGVRVPANLLERGAVYRIRIVAIDPTGNKSTLLIPFRT